MKKIIIVLSVLLVITSSFFTFNLLNNKNLDQSSDASAPNAGTIEQLTNILKTPTQYDELSDKRGIQSLKSLEEIAQDRKQMILKAMKENPEIVFKNKLSKEERSALPMDVQENIEKDSTTTGRIRMLEHDNFKDKKHESQYVIKPSLKETKKLYLSDKKNMLRVNPLSQYSVTGIEIDNSILIENKNLTTLKQSSQLIEPASIASKKTAIILFNFQNDTSEPYTPEYTKDSVFNTANAFYKENSNQKFSLTGKNNPDGDIFGWYTLPLNSDEFCDDRELYKWATTALQNAGFPIDEIDFWDPTSPAYLSGYNHFIFAFSKSNLCSWAGISETPGEFSWINGLKINGYYSGFEPYIFAHELGHNLGSGHANALSCIDSSSNKVPITLELKGCTELEYEDKYDIMGNAQYHRHMSAYHKVQAGIVESSKSVKVTSNGLYEIAALEEGSDKIQSLQIFRTNSELDAPYYYVDFRKNYGLDDFSQDNSVTNGVMIRIGDEYTYDYYARPSYIIDTTPETATFDDATLTIGKSYYDPVYKIKIEPLQKKKLSNGQDGIEIRITFGDQQIPTTIPTSIPTSIPTPNPTINPTTASTKQYGDFNHDEKVNILDLSILATLWNQTGTLAIQADANNDGKVNILDLSILATYWEKTVI